MAHENATPRPWAAERSTYGVTVRRPDEYGSTPICEVWANGDDREANAALIVEAVNAYDALIAERDRLAAENERLRAALVTISLNDWYTRRVRQQEHGGLRGMAGMLATRALMEENPSYIGNEAVIARFGDPRDRVPA